MDVLLKMMSEDTMNQVRSFYTHLQKSKIKDLIKKDSKVQLNIHFTFKVANLVWTDVKIGKMECVDYWIKNLPNLGQVNRSNFHEYCKNLEQAGIILPDNCDDINTKIINTNMQKINMCPGMYFSYSTTSLLILPGSRLMKQRRYGSLRVIRVSVLNCARIS